MESSFVRFQRTRRGRAQLSKAKPTYNSLHELCQSTKDKRNALNFKLLLFFFLLLQKMDVKYTIMLNSKLQVNSTKLKQTQTLCKLAYQKEV